MAMSEFEALHRVLKESLYLGGEVVDVGEWQSIRGDIPQSRTIELQDINFRIQIPDSIASLQMAVKPTLPWAEDHFLERVSGEPLNPPPSASYWNRNQDAVDVHRTVKEAVGYKQYEMKYSHTYPERFWPKSAGTVQYTEHPYHHKGIRFLYGDLNDVVSLLAKSPLTRQAYLPVWFPEDTGAVHGERVPCTLGYHFLLRGGRLHVYYFIRSCDFLRHFRNDVYLAARLCQWMINAVYRAYQRKDALAHPNFVDVRPGNLIMQISSLHVFEAERKRLET